MFNFEPNFTILRKNVVVVYITNCYPSHSQQGASYGHHDEQRQAALGEAGGVDCRVNGLGCQAAPSCQSVDVWHVFACTPLCETENFEPQDQAFKSPKDQTQTDLDS